MPKKNVEEPELVNDAPPATGDDNKLILARELFPKQLSILSISGRPAFPKMTAPMVVDNDDMKQLLRDAIESKSKYLGLVLRREDETRGAVNRPDDATKSDATSVYDVGVIAEILQVAQPEGDGPINLLIGVLERMRIVKVTQEKPYLRADVEYMFETEMSSNEELKAYSLSVIQSLKELVQLNPLHKEELGLFMSHSSLSDPGRLADFSAALTTAEGRDLQDILATVSIRTRLRKTLVLLKKEIDISKIQVRIHKQIEEKLTKQQRDFFLREQLKAIKKELGLEKEGKQADIEQFSERVMKLTLTDEARERIDEEIEKLKMIEPVSPEFNVTRNYLDWLTILPWGVFTDDNYDIARSERVLNQDHYGLDDVKQRILEFLAVGIMKGNISGSIICFVGPPGVGKTSIGQSIARSIGRNFYRFSLGGIRDEAEIKGHRRTYIGAMPGKFIQVMKVCKSANPVIMLDEIDKVGASYHGDPASALLEVLDPEQNSDFLDHYLDVRFDLSNVFFICTANQLDTIPRPLLDRMEVIKLAGYITREKLEIARRYLIPKQLEEHGLKKNQVRITAGALREIVDGYARDPGVRSVEKHIKKILRKAAREIVADKTRRIKVDTPEVREYLGKRLFEDDMLFKYPAIGVVTGLAWTSMGGDTLFIEASSVATGKPGFKQTGQLGDVMVESTEIAYTYVRSFFENDKQAAEFFAKNMVHLHVPAGATPKDGPSAGITMACALFSLAKKQTLKPGFAMTGELTLTGQVMPIGGIKEKTIAARRSKIRKLIFPAGNRKDYEELPDHIRSGLKPYFVETFSEVVDICF